MSVQMMNKTIKDEFGFILPNCYAGITMGLSVSADGFELVGDNFNGEYEDVNETETIRYKVSYFASSQHFNEGYPPRPLKVKKGDVFTDKLEVDLENPRVMSILSQNIPQRDKVLACIEADLDYRLES